MGRISLRRSSGDGLPRSSGRRSDHPEDQRQVLPRREGESLGRPSHLKTAPVHIWRRFDGWPLRNHIAGPFLPAIIAPFFTATVKRERPSYLEPIVSTAIGTAVNVMG